MHALLSKPRQILPPCRRIRRSTDFDQIFRANCIGNKWFAVYTRKNESGFSRLGMVASKRIMPKAVSRNFAKRLIREVFRSFFSVDCALDVVVRVKQKLSPDISSEGRLALVQLLEAAQK